MRFSQKHEDEQLLYALEPQTFVLHFKSFKKETLISTGNKIRLVFIQLICPKLTGLNRAYLKLLAKEPSKKVCIGIQAGSRKWFHKLLCERHIHVETCMLHLGLCDR